MFRKKDRQVTIHQANVKRGITTHFVRSLKLLQQRHIHPDGEEFIYSDDYSNNLCGSLEAVFLHGLKDSVVSKMSNYVGLANNQDQALYINFWSICVNFTHKDVITQLKNLPQISTDIGLCRAWIRIALNDGLMESYLHSMIVDHKFLAYYYHSYSYMRDHEQPGILKNFLTGLMSLSFQLSFNSSMLNVWSNTSLQLAGVLDYHNTPRPSVSEASKQQAPYQEDNGTGKPKDKEPIVASKSVDSPSEGRGLSFSPSQMQFMSLPHAAAPHRGSVTQTISSSLSIKSDGSTSSQISCPDPGFISCRDPGMSPGAGRPSDPETEDKTETQPHLLPPTGDGRFVGSETSQEDSLTRGKDRAASEDLPVFQLDLDQIPQEIMNQEKSEESLENAISQTVSRVDTGPTPASVPEFSSRSEPCPVVAAESPFDTNCKRDENKAQDQDENSSTKKDSKLRNSIGVARGYEEICATLPPLKLDPLEQEAILRKVLGEIDKQADKERELREDKRTRLGQKQIEKKDRAETANDQVDKMRQEAVKFDWRMSPELRRKRSNCIVTDNIDDHVSVGKQTDRNSLVYSTKELEVIVPELEKDTNKLPKLEVNFVEHDFYVQDDSMKADEGCETQEASPEIGDVDLPIAANQGGGNSLNDMLGWSSEFDTHAKESSNKTGRVKTRGESFTTMLRAYTGDNSLISTTLNQVIQKFYGEEASPPQAVDVAGQGEDEDTEEEQDSGLDDFEILSVPMSSSVQSVQDMDSCRTFFLFHTPREHGLSHQNFTCKGCSRPIGVIYGPPRLCEFDGGLYCFECHENNESIIPSAILYNWDFRKKQVCVENHRLLQALEDQPLYNLDELNPKLRTHVPELDMLISLRNQLCFLKSYMFNCTQSVAESLRQKVWPREHLYDHCNLFSISDFLQLQSGTLVRFVKDLVKFASKHVYECSLCNQKGFVCEICRNPQVIFPFETHTTLRCSTCKAVYHKTCISESLPCPKCERWNKRKQASSETCEDFHPEDYGASPP